MFNYMIITCFYVPAMFNRQLTANGGLRYSMAINGGSIVFHSNYVSSYVPRFVEKNT